MEFASNDLALPTPNKKNEKRKMVLNSNKTCLNQTTWTVLSMRRSLLEIALRDYPQHLQCRQFQGLLGYLLSQESRDHPTQKALGKVSCLIMRMMLQLALKALNVLPTAQAGFSTFQIS